MRFLIFLLCCLVLPASAQTTPPAISARAWALLDYGSGQILASGNVDTPLEPASLTKVMSPYLIYPPLKQKALTPEQVVP